jgi:hypothetical protein
MSRLDLLILMRLAAGQAQGQAPSRSSSGSLPYPILERPPILAERLVFPGIRRFGAGKKAVNLRFQFRLRVSSCARSSWLCAWRHSLSSSSRRARHGQVSQAPRTHESDLIWRPATNRCGIQGPRAIDDPVWLATVFSKNRDRHINSDNRAQIPGRYPVGTRRRISPSMPSPMNQRNRRLYCGTHPKDPQSHGDFARRGRSSPRAHQGWKPAQRP